MINPSIAIVGVAVQSAKDVAATKPTYSHGVTGGTPFKSSISTQTDSVACGVRAPVDTYKKEIAAAADYDTRAYADVLGVYLLGALGKCVTTGETELKTHVFTMADVLPYLTEFSQIGGSVPNTIINAKVDELDLSFSGNAPLDIGVTLAGTDGYFTPATWPSDISPSCFDGYFTSIGSSFKFAVDSATPADQAVIIQDGEIKIANNIEAEYAAGKITPEDIAEGKLSVSITLTAKPEDKSLIRRVLTGSDTGTELTGKMVYGSIEWSFVHTKDATLTLKVESSKVPFSVSDLEADPDGKAADVKFSCDAALIASATDSPVKVTLVNKVASY